MRALPARHVLLVSDACFSGALFRDLELSAAADVPSDSVEARRLARDRSRWVITSGGDEPVVDRYREGMSVFAYFFKAELERSAGRYLSADAIFPELRDLVVDNARQTPRQGPFQGTGHEGGQLVMVDGSAGGRDVDIKALAAKERACQQALDKELSDAAEEWAVVEPLLAEQSASTRALVQAWADKWGGGAYARCEGGARSAEVPGVADARVMLKEWPEERVSAVPRVPVPRPGGNGKHPSRGLLAGGLGTVVAGGACLVATVALDAKFMETPGRDDAETWYNLDRAALWSGAALGVAGGGLVVGAVVRGRW